MILNIKMLKSITVDFTTTETIGFLKQIRLLRHIRFLVCKSNTNISDEKNASFYVT